MQNNQLSLQKYISRDFKEQYNIEDDGDTEDRDCFDKFKDNDDFFNGNYVELNDGNDSLAPDNLKLSQPHINSKEGNDLYNNRDSFLSTTINFADYDNDDDDYHYEDDEIHYLNFIRKSKIAVSQQNSLAQNQNGGNYQPEENIKTYTIVCIDDSKAVVNAIKMYLDDNIFSVVGINDPLKALMQVIRLKPDLILLDITMPTLDGYELCSLLRKHSGLKETPIVMVTGKKGIINRVKAKMVKASDYITKPFGKKDLLKVIFKYIV